VVTRAVHSAGEAVKPCTYEAPGAVKGGWRCPSRSIPGARACDSGPLWRGKWVPAAPSPLLVAVGNGSNGALAEDAL